MPLWLNFAQPSHTEFEFDDCKWRSDSNSCHDGSVPNLSRTDLSNKVSIGRQKKITNIATLYYFVMYLILSIQVRHKVLPMGDSLHLELDLNYLGRGNISRNNMLQLGA